jgi:hypothetical protein
MLAMLLIISSFTFLVGFSAAGWISRTAFKLASKKIIAQELRIRQQQSVMKELLFEASHKGMNPVMKSFRGLQGSLRPELKAMDENLAQAEKPGHHRYATYSRKLLKGLGESMDHLEALCINAESRLSVCVSKMADLIKEI